MALIDKASLLMVPSTYEDGTLYNVLPSGNKAPDETGSHNGYDQTRADFTFSRGSNLAATRVNSDGLIEKGRENLILQSNSFDNWSKSNSSVTGGQSGYDGTNDAYKLVSNTSNAGHRVFQAQVQTGVLTFSIYAKAGGYDFMFIYINGKYAYFDLANGSVGTESGLIDSSIAAAGNDFYRCSITFSGVTTSNVEVYIANTGSSYVFTGDGTSGIFIQDAQFEQSLVPTDYIESGSVSGTAGVLENTPRIDYSSGAGALLLESQRTNLITNSEYGGTWLTSSASVSVNAVTSPEGVQNANTITITANSGSAYIENVAVTASTSYTFSFYVKQGTNTENYLAVRDQSNSTFISTDVSYTASATEWKRVDYTFTTPSGCTSVRLYPQRYSTGGQGTTHIWGAQLEAASYASSYIPTHGAAVTRGADSCTKTSISNVLNASEGTLFTEMNCPDNSATSKVITIGNSTTNKIQLFYYQDSIRLNFTAGGVSQAYLQKSITVTDTIKVAARYSANDVRLYVNGSLAASDTSATMPSALDYFRFDNGSGGAIFIGDVKQAIYFDEELTDAECVTLTTL